MSAKEGSDFFLSVSLLTGRYVAADLTHRDAAEWPPHPGRLFMALVASVFETDAEPEEVAAIDWLGSLEPPDVIASEAYERSSPAVYVPINDRADNVGGQLTRLPGLLRPHQARHFPTSIPEHDQVDFVYRAERSALNRHAKALASVTAEVVRIGHSSSLVAVAVCNGLPEVANRLRWKAGGTGATVAAKRLRVPDAHSIARLEASFGRAQREEFHAARDEVLHTKGNAQKAAKEQFKEVTGLDWKASLKPMPPAPARIARFVDYRIQGETNEAELPINTEFDDGLLILAKLDGPVLDLLSTLPLIKALRGLLLKNVGSKAPEWITGHAEDGSASRAPHLSLVPLPFVGHKHADGHLLGVGICVPRSIDEREVARHLGPILVDQSTGEPKLLTLTLGSLGTWDVSLEVRSTPPRTLQMSEWVGKQSSREWVTVTPIVLERFPKQNRRKNHSAWMAEIEDLVSLSCRHAGLPEPAVLSVGKNAWCTGVPRAVARPGRGASKQPSDDSSRPGILGSGYSQFSSNVQVHAKIAFNEPVRGPLLLGKGRFQGYGLCRPVTRIASRRTLKE